MNLFQKLLLIPLSTSALGLTGCPSSDPPVNNRGPHGGTISGTTLDRGIPRGGKTVAERDGEIRYTAPADGSLYLVDVRDEKVVDSRPIRRGQEYVANPKDEKVWIDDKRVGEPTMNSDHTHRLVFADPRAVDDRRDPRDDRGTVDRGNAAGRVPDTAELVKEARRDDLSWVASDDGTVYLYDNDNATLVETFNVQKGQRLTVSPTNGVASLDGKQVMRKDLGTRSTYRLLFDRR